MHLFLLFDRSFLNPSDIPLCHSSQVTHGCQVVNVADVKIKLNGIMNGEAETEGETEQGQGRLDCYGEK